MTEPILDERNNRHTYFPIKHQKLHDLYKKQLGCFWTTDEIDFGKDRAAFKALRGPEQEFIKSILAFFAASDGIVMENIVGRFMEEVKLSEARACYSVQNFMEQIHSETYSLLIDTIVEKNEEKDRLFNAVENFPAIKQKADWALKWIGDRKRSYGSRLVAFACVEGIQFSGAFCAIYWLKSRNIGMNGLTFSNELISRDEALHVETAIALFKELERKPSVSKIHEIIKEAVEIERHFICEALPCRIIGMNDVLMAQYIEFVADRLCLQLSVPKIYEATNPFNFMETISLEGKTNFFEKRVGEYGLAERKQTPDDFKLEFDF